MSNNKKWADSITYNLHDYLNGTGEFDPEYGKQKAREMGAEAGARRAKIEAELFFRILTQSSKKDRS